MEQILLRNACIVLGKFGETVGIELCHNTLYPYVHRETLHTVHSVQQSALRNLGANALYGHKRLSCFFNRRLGYPVKVNFTAVYLVNAVLYVLCTKACP